MAIGANFNGTQDHQPTNPLTMMRPSFGVGPGQPTARPPERQTDNLTWRSESSFFLSFVHPHVSSNQAGQSLTIYLGPKRAGIKIAPTENGGKRDKETNDLLDFRVLFISLFLSHAMGHG